MRPVALIILLIVTLVPFCGLGVCAEESRSTNCLVVLKGRTGDSIDKLSPLESLIELHGGEVRHVFWPTALFAYVEPGMERILEEQPLVSRVIRSSISIPEARNAGLPSFVAASWNRILAGEVRTGMRMPSVQEGSQVSPSSLANDVKKVPVDPALTGVDPKDRFTSSYLIGRVAVGIFLMESIGSYSTEDWSDADRDTAISRAVLGLELLRGLADREGAQLSWFYEIHENVTTLHEPINGNAVPYWNGYTLTNVYDWLNDAMNSVGHGEGLGGIYSYLNSMRHTYQTDWAHIIFVVKGENDPDHLFADGTPSYAPLPCEGDIEFDLPPWDCLPIEIGCLYAVTIFEGIGSAYDFTRVVVHETLHVFGADDEYEGTACECQGDEHFVNYLDESNENCYTCTSDQVPCIMNVFGAEFMCAWTKGQIGWRHLYDADSIPDAIDPNSHRTYEIVEVLPGDRVTIRTVPGDVVKTYAATPDNTFFCQDLIGDWHHVLVWDGTNNGGEFVLWEQAYTYQINDGDPVAFTLLYNPQTVAYVHDISLVNDNQLQFAFQNIGNLLCRIRNETGAVVATPVYNRLLCNCTYTIPLGNLSAGNYTATFRCWTSYGTNSVSEFPFTIEGPEAPSQVACDVRNCRTVFVTWVDNSSNEDGFKVERQISCLPGSPFELIATLGANITHYCDFVPYSSCCYNYRITAFNSHGSSEPASGQGCTGPENYTGPTEIAAGSVCGGWGPWGSPYLIEGNIDIASGASLTIAPNTQLKFAAGASLTVRGILRATNVDFTSNSGTPQPGDWHGLHFTEGGICSLSACTVRYAQTGIEVVGDPGCLSFVIHGSAILNTCSVSHCSEAAVFGGALAYIDAYHCTFHTNYAGLRYLGKPNYLKVKDCTFRCHEFAALEIYPMCAYTFYPIIENNLFEDRSDWHGEGWDCIGIRLAGNVHGPITGNTIQGFYDGIVLITDGGFPGYTLAPHPTPFSGNTISGNYHYNLIACSAPVYQDYCGNYTLLAEGNNWGANKSSEIEQKIYHCVDSHWLYFIDFNPWVNPPSGCPYVYSWDGEQYVEENTVLGASGFSGGRVSATDYLKLSGVKVDAGKVKLEIREFEQERSNLDAFTLLTIDYPSSASMFLSPQGEPRLYDGVVLPASVLDADGGDRLSRLVYADGALYEGKAGDCLTFDFAAEGGLDALTPHDVNASGKGHGKKVDLIVVAGGKPAPCEGDCIPPIGGVQIAEGTSPIDDSPLSETGVAINERASGKGGILVQVPVEEFGQMRWKSVARIVPREKLSELVVPGEVLGEPRPSRLRFLWDGKHYIDYVAYGGSKTTAGDSDLKVSAWPLSSALHSAAGDVTRSLSSDDFAATDLASGDRITLSFAVDENVQPDMSRCYILKSVGSYRSAQQASAQTERQEKYFLKVASANPFNPSVRIDYGLAAAAKVLIRVYATDGRVISTLADDFRSAGTNTVTWDGTDSSGKRVSSGVYFVKLETSEYKETKKIALLR